MYSRNIQLFAPQVCPTTASALYTTPTNTRTRIAKVTATNTGTSTRAVTLYLVPSGGTAGASNTIVSAMSVGPGQDVTLVSAVGHVIEPGGSIQAIVDTGTDLTIMASGTEVTT